jgi:hypothetical protein
MGFVLAGADGEEQRSPVSQGIDRALEAEPIQREPPAEGGVKHDGADQIVGNRLHPDFPLDQFRRLAAQDVQAHGDLDVPHEQFDPPAPQVQFGEGLVRVKNAVEQRGGHDDRLGSEAGHHDAAAIPLGPSACGCRSGGGLGRWDFGLQFSSLGREHPQPYAKRGADDDGDNAPPSANNVTTNLHTQAEDDADQVSKAREAEDHAGDS